MFNLFKKKIPHCNNLFNKYLSPWYPENDRPDMPRPDLYTISVFEGKKLNLDELQYLEPEFLEESREQINTILKAAKQDYQEISSFDSFDLTVLDTVDKFYNKEVVSDI